MPQWESFDHVLWFNSKNTWYIGLVPQNGSAVRGGESEKSRDAQLSDMASPLRGFEQGVA